MPFVKKPYKTPGFKTTRLGKFSLLDYIQRPSPSQAARLRERLGTNPINRIIAKYRKGVRTKAKQNSYSYVNREPVARGQGIETNFVKYTPPTLAVSNMKKVNPVNNILKQFGGFMEYGPGRQAALTLQTSFTLSDFNNILSNLPARDLSNNANRRFLMDNLKSEITMSNGTNASCYVHVYDIMCKTDIDSNDFAAGIGDPATAWLTGEVQQGNASGYNVIGTDPRKVDTFKQHYKVLNVKKHFMKPGDIHKHKISITLNKIMNEARLLNSSRYAGVSFSTMLVVYGCPAQDDSSPPVVTTTGGVINYTYTSKYQYRFSLDNQQNSIVIPSLLPTPASLEVVQEDGDIDVVNNA